MVHITYNSYYVIRSGVTSSYGNRICLSLISSRYRSSNHRTLQSTSCIGIDEYIALNTNGKIDLPKSAIILKIFSIWTYAQSVVDEYLFCGVSPVGIVREGLRHYSRR